MHNQCAFFFILSFHVCSFVARHGPVTYMDKTEKYEFLKLVSKIQVDGGGDCDELAISGARNIFGSSLQYRSPIYVLTDAGPKDATEDHLDAVKEMIISYKTPINFFLSNAGKLSSYYTKESIRDFGSIKTFGSKETFGSIKAFGPQETFGPIKAGFHFSEFLSKIFMESAKCVFIQQYSKQIWLIETRPNQAVCSYWSAIAKDDSNFFVLGFLLSEFAEKLNIFQLLCFSREFAYVQKGQKLFQSLTNSPKICLSGNRASGV